MKAGVERKVLNVKDARMCQHYCDIWRRVLCSNYMCAAEFQ